MTDNPFKDFATLRAAVERLGEASPRTMLVVLGGTTSNEQVGHVEIRMTGTVTDDAAVAAHYQAADLYVHPSRADTFPSAVLEAMGSGLPVVATSVGGIPEQVTDGHTGLLVPERSPEALINAMMRLIGDADARARMGREGRRRALAAYTQERQVKEHMAWISRVVEEATTTTSTST